MMAVHPNEARNEPISLINGRHFIPSDKWLSHHGFASLYRSFHILDFLGFLPLNSSPRLSTRMDEMNLNLRTM